MTQNTPSRVKSHFDHTLTPTLLLPAGQGMLWETSLLDAEEGIRFRGYSIPELQVSVGKGVREVWGRRCHAQISAWIGAAKCQEGHLLPWLLHFKAAAQWELLERSVRRAGTPVAPKQHPIWAISAVCGTVIV